MPAPSLPYRPGLDGLRGLAVAAVLLFHSGVTWVGGGFLGVSTFFTLSGFLITTLLLREHEQAGTIRFRSFWSRRTRRLLPASVLAIGIAVVFVATVAVASQVVTARGDLLAALFAVANWRFIAEGTSYRSLFAAPSPVLQFWSLAVEEQLYVVVPVVAIVALRRRSRRAFGVTLAVLFAASAALPHVVTMADDRVYFGTDTRAAELLAGALLAFALSSGRARSLARRLAPSGSAAARRATVAGRVVGVGAFAAVLALWVTTTQTSGWVYSGGLAAFAGLSVLVIVAALDHRGPVGRLLSVAPLRALGAVSYGVYLYHWPIFLWLTPQRTGWSTGVRLVVCVGLTLAAAVASYRLIEEPVHRRVGIGARRLTAGALGAVALSAVVVLVVTSVRPVPFDTDVLAAPAGALVTDHDVARSPSTVTPANGTPPPVRSPLVPRAVQPPSRPLRVLVVGDSTAAYLNGGLSSWGEDRRIWTTTTYARIGCGIGRGGTRDHNGFEEPPATECDEWATEWQGYLDQIRPDLVIVSSGLWDATDRKLAGDDTWRRPGDPVYDAYLRDEYTAAVELLSSGGAVVVWLDNPPIQLGQDAVPPLQDRFSVNQPERMRRLNALLAEVATTEPRLRVVALSQFFAAWPGGPFDPTLRPDGVHVGMDGAPVVAEWLGPEILAAYRDAA